MPSIGAGLISYYKNDPLISNKQKMYGPNYSSSQKALTLHEIHKFRRLLDISHVK